MSRYANMSKLAKNGAVDSKYFGKADQFEKDIKQKLEKSENFKEELRNLIIENPSNIKNNYINAIHVLLKIKEEFNIII